MKNEALKQKLLDMDISGYVVEFTPEEAEILGFIVEDAMDYKVIREAKNRASTFFILTGYLTVIL